LADFYIRVFDCKPRPPERDLSGEWVDKLTGLPNTKIKGIHLLLPGYDIDGPTLEIIDAEIEGVGKITVVYARDPEGNIIEIQKWE